MADSEIRKLQVANARPEDSGRGLARLSRATMNALGLAEGDVVEIVGRRSTPARAVLPYAEDEGLELHRRAADSRGMNRTSGPRTRAVAGGAGDLDAAECRVSDKAWCGEATNPQRGWDWQNGRTNSATSCDNVW